jgi:hypothetical protein
MKNQMSELKFINKADNSISSGINHGEIASALSKYFYDQPKMLEGKAIYDNVINLWKQNKTEHNEENVSYGEFDKQLSELAISYGSHRNNSKKFLRNDSMSKSRLKIDGSLPEAYLPYIEQCEEYYDELNSDPSLLAKLAPILITDIEVTEGIAQIDRVKQARKSYLTEKGEAENATIIKDNAMAELDAWMDDFMVIADIALEEKPQLKEIFGLVVKR